MVRLQLSTGSYLSQLALHCLSCVGVTCSGLFSLADGTKYQSLIGWRITRIWSESGSRLGSTGFFGERMQDTKQAEIPSHIQVFSTFIIVPCYWIKKLMLTGYRWNSLSNVELNAMQRYLPKNVVGISNENKMTLWGDGNSDFMTFMYIMSPVTTHVTRDARVLSAVTWSDTWLWPGT